MKEPIKAPDLTGEVALRDMPISELKNIDAPKIKVHCCVSGCNRFSSGKDFGEHPFYFWGRKWVNLREIVFYCGKHWKLFKAGKINNEQYKPGPAIHHLKPENND